MRHLGRNKKYLATILTAYKQVKSIYSDTLQLEPASVLSSSTLPNHFDKYDNVAKKFDVAERDTRNRALGSAGEQLGHMH